MIKMQIFYLLLLLACAASGRVFNNPIIKGHVHPGAINANGIYYIVTASEANRTSKLPIYMSADLSNWAFVTYVFSETNKPIWMTTNTTYQAFYDPEIHYINNVYHVYYDTYDLSGQRAIGVATGLTPIGPFTDLGKPILSSGSNYGLADPTIIQNNGSLTLLYRNETTPPHISAVSLTPDGLSLVTETTSQIFLGELEDNPSEPWHISRGSYSYLFYTRGGSDILVGRSSSPLGPYDVRADPILTATGNSKLFKHASIVKDSDGVTDILVFSDDQSNISLATLKWGEDAWPDVVHLFALCA